MKSKILAIITLMLVVSLSLSSCVVVDFAKDLFNQLFGSEIELTDKPLEAEKLVDFSSGAPDASVLFESDGWSNGDVFNVVWKKHNVHFENGIMRLGITEEKASAWLNDADVEFNYTAGEARTANYYHYGDYEVSMKPSANEGTASTFFVCTGPYDLKDGVPNAHDEIDIEFLGKDTTHVQFNFFVNGVGGNEYMYDLGFDASEEFHTYGFRWMPDSITWFVDGKPVYKVTTDTSVKEGKNVRVVDALPQTAGRMLSNYWCGNERAWGWMGQYNGETKDNGTQYQWIATSAEGAPLNPPVDPPIGGGETEEIDWSAIEPLSPAFPAVSPYEVSVDGNKADITYTDVAGNSYTPLELDVEEAVAGKNFVHLKVTNNGTETANVRVNMFDPTLTGNNKATNISATMDGVAVFTDLDWGGSFFDIPAGKTAELVVQFGVGGTKLQLMIDSSKNDATLRSGNITVEELKFAAVGEVELPHQCTDTDGDYKCDDCSKDIPHSCADADGDDKCDLCGKDMIVPPSPPQNPTSGNLNLTLGDFTTTIGGNVTDGYGVNVNDDGTISVEYTNIVGDSYKNIWADISSIAGTKTTFSVKVTNNGTAAVKVRIDIESQTKTSENTTCCNVSAKQDGVDVYTDTTWGGSMFEIAAGATVTLEVVYNPANKPTNVKIMIDSHTYQDSNVYAGNITLSDLSFSGEYTPDQGGETTPPAGDDEPTVEYTDLYVEFKTENAYTLTSPDTYANSVRVTYSNIAYDTWGNINIWVADKSADCSVFSMKLTNHGADQVSVFVKVEDASSKGLVEQNINIAAGAEETFTFNYSGTAQMIFFFVDSSSSAVEGTHAGDITISEIKLGKVAASEDNTNPPEGGNDTPVEGEYLDFKLNDGNVCYTLEKADTYVNSVRVTYSEVSDKTYQNVNAWVQDKAAGKTTLNVTVKNNGTESVRFTLKLENSTGGAKDTTVNIASGETVTISLEYDFAPDLIYFFIDSGWIPDDQTAETHAGDVTISGINFK